MDQTTQQNSALVEEMSAAANALHSQAQELVQTVEVFKLPDSQYSAAGRSVSIGHPPQYLALNAS